MTLLSRRDPRKNHLLRSVVNFGLQLARNDLGNAARYMADHQVPEHVALRTLLKKPEK